MCSCDGGGASFPDPLREKGRKGTRDPRPRKTDRMAEAAAIAGPWTACVHRAGRAYGYRRCSCVR